MRLTGLSPSLSHGEGEGWGGVGFFSIGLSASRLTPLLRPNLVGNAPAEHGSALPVLQEMERIGWHMRLKSFAAAVLLGFSTAAAAKQPLPDAHAEQVFDLWLAAYNSGERDALQTFLTDYKVGQDAQRFLDIRQSLGTFKLLGVKSSTAGNAQLILLSEMTDRGVLVTLDLDPADRFDVTKLQLEGMDLPDEFKPQRMSRTEVLAAGKARLDAARAADTLSGALLVAKNGKVLLAWHGGAADRERAVGVDETTRFRLASLNKMFTAVAILQLQHAGKLSLDDTVATHLENYPNQEVARTISIRQLLNHTSGLGDVFGEEFEKRFAIVTDLERLLEPRQRHAAELNPGQ